MLLEFESDLAYLGMVIIPKRCNFEVGMQVPGYDEIEESTDSITSLRYSQWRYRTTNSVGSRKGLVSGFECRLHHAARLTHPHRQGQEAIAKILAIAVLTGQGSGILKRIVRKHSAKYPAIYNKWLRDWCYEALCKPTPECISMLRRAVARARRT